MKSTLIKLKDLKLHTVDKAHIIELKDGSELCLTYRIYDQENPICTSEFVEENVNDMTIESFKIDVDEDSFEVKLENIPTLVNNKSIFKEHRKSNIDFRSVKLDSPLRIGINESNRNSQVTDELKFTPSPGLSRKLHFFHILTTNLILNLKIFQTVNIAIFSILCLTQISPIL